RLVKKKKKKKNRDKPEKKMEAASVTASSLIRVAALSGSLRKSSYNRGLIRSDKQYVDQRPADRVRRHLTVATAEHGSGRRGSFPPAIEAFRQKILEADCILFASPEYNYSMSAPLKNAVDWASRPPNVWAGKAAAIVSAGGGFGGRSQYHLRQVGVFLDLHFINKPEFFCMHSSLLQSLTVMANLIDEQAKERLKEVLLSLQALSLKLHRKQ
ncbi:NADPH:quinone oxidoreductase, partial [Prunus dulcis]